MDKIPFLVINRISTFLYKTEMKRILSFIGTNDCQNCYNSNVSIIKFKCNHRICLKCLYNLKKDRCYFCNSKLDSDIIGLSKMLHINIELYKKCFNEGIYNQNNINSSIYEFLLQLIDL